MTMILQLRRKTLSNECIPLVRHGGTHTADGESRSQELHVTVHDQEQ
jgi:hypothetical protein